VESICYARGVKPLEDAFISDEELASYNQPATDWIEIPPTCPKLVHNDVLRALAKIGFANPYATLLDQVEAEFGDLLEHGPEEAFDLVFLNPENTSGEVTEADVIVTVEFQREFVLIYLASLMSPNDQQTPE
jgi:hypothetical protein